MKVLCAIDAGVKWTLQTIAECVGTVNRITRFVIIVGTVIYPICTKEDFVGIVKIKKIFKNHLTNQTFYGIIYV